MSIIKVNNLSKEFTYYEKDAGIKNSLKNLFSRKELIKTAVKDISFEIEEGEIVGFLGPNGAGKTTTLKMLSGILYPSGGSASIMGYTPWERKKEFKKQFSIVMGQKNQLWWDLPANESLYLNKCIYEIEDKEYKKTVGELTELLDVKDLLKVQVRRLSLGERMKMELIASLLHKPKILFLDEPTIGLDIISQRNIRDFINNYNKEAKTTVILTSHYMHDIEDLCKRTIVINDGKIVYDGDLKKVNEVFSKTKIIKLQLEVPVKSELLETFGKVKEHSGLNAILEINKTDIRNQSKMMLDKLPILDFNIEDIPIEEGIAMLYKKEGDSNEVA
ncbi:ABC transporter ATP-binding protein [Clostridium beijerinckii]|uniref:ABC transporter ATP-binding protein n=1 Tax=Clostridium beijerinckii TaxID=1520 RepID=UPI001495026A|nr:ABC transporter ATP-binding protein [Clostridium beijerinckii]NOW06646.1 ABC-2 type transport system ATP-binding protein [Clostridium beijerinckii]NYC00210.1 ABC-2 type transport system ATP-binding protein [Clostridium beijerinckii]